MKKILITSTLLFIGFSVLLTSCLSTGTVSNRTLTLPESPEAAARKIVELEKQGEYLYSFKAENYKGNLCKFYILDNQYLKIVYPDKPNEPLYYYYKLNGDYLDYSVRKGVFGHAIGINVAEVDELLFRNNFVGGYKFSSRSDQISHDKKYQAGNITWNVPRDERKNDPSYFLDFFKQYDKVSYDNKRDLAGTLYYTMSALQGFNVTWENQEAATANDINSEDEKDPDEM